MRTRAWIVLALLIVLGLGAPVPAQDAPDDLLAAMRDERRVALVVGNAAYPPSIGWLPNPTNDARAMAEVLEELGFNVTLLINATRNQLQEALVPFEQALRAADVGLFYYAGHAVQIAGRNFMIPINVELDIPPDADPEAVAHYADVKTVDVDQVLGLMAIARNRLNIVILDACRDNPFARSVRGITRGLAQTSAPRGTLVAYSTAPGRVALDGPAGGHSLYTEALLDVLREPGLPIESAFKRVRERLIVDTNGHQTPWEHSSLVGEFYFRLPEPAPPPAATPAVDLAVWDAIKDSRLASDFELFLATYPDSPLAPFARTRLEGLRAEDAPVMAALPPDQEEAPAPSPEPLSDPAALEAALNLRAEDRRIVQQALAAPTPPAAAKSSVVEAPLDLGESDRRLMQEALKALGFDPGKIDGIFGARTERAIEGWQRHVGSVPTGRLTPFEYNKLLAEADPKLPAIAASAESLEKTSLPRANSEVAALATTTPSPSLPSLLSQDVQEVVSIAVSSFSGDTSTARRLGSMIADAVNADIERSTLD